MSSSYLVATFSIFFVSVRVRDACTHLVGVLDVMPVAWRCRDLFLEGYSDGFLDVDHLLDGPQFCDFMIDFDWDFFLDGDFYGYGDLLLPHDLDLNGGVDHDGSLDLGGDFDLDLFHFDDGFEEFLLDLDHVRDHHLFFNEAFGRDFDFFVDLDEFGDLDRNSLDEVLGDFDDAGNADLNGLGL